MQWLMHALQRRIIISHKDFKFIRVDVSVPEIYVLLLIFETGKMSQAGIEPATYGSHTK